MTTVELYHEASRRGLTLKPAGDKLAVIPARLCTSDFAAMLREHKSELLALLANGGRVADTVDCFQLDLQGDPAPIRKLARPQLPVVKPYRPLTRRERDILRRKGLENDPLIIEALNIFRATIIE